MINVIRTAPLSSQFSGFHTSPDIPDVGGEFDPDEFIATLKKARVDSVTLCARCHHGHLYYDSKVHPELIHPQLARPNFLLEQIEACQKNDIRVTIYTTVEFDFFMTEEHPEWLAANADGSPHSLKIAEDGEGGHRHTTASPYDAGFYRWLCLNSPYVEFLREHVQDILESLPTDGIFFDILMPQDCSCVCCRRSMKERGIDAADGAARKQFGLQVVVDFINEMTRFVRRFNDHCSVYYNSGHIGPWYRRILGACTHFDLESLPAAQWGFMHFPLTMRYIRGLNLDTQGLTSTVQTTWGDIHSFKSQASIEFECFQMLALGAKPALGQQSHPSGKLCGGDF